MRPDSLSTRANTQEGQRQRLIFAGFHGLYKWISQSEQCGCSTADFRPCGQSQRETRCVPAFEREDGMFYPAPKRARRSS